MHTFCLSKWESSLNSSEEECLALWCYQKHLVKNCLWLLETFVKLAFLLCCLEGLLCRMTCFLDECETSRLVSVITLTTKALSYQDEDEASDSRMFCERGSFENKFPHLILFSCHLSLSSGKEGEQQTNLFDTKSWLLVHHYLTGISSGLKQYWEGQGIILSKRSIFKVLSEAII